MSVWTEEKLTSQGVALSDEGLHPFAPGDSSWNESLFFDWIEAEGSRAGHCRIGRHPGLGTLWVWIYLYDGSRWVSYDAHDLALDALSPDGWDYQSPSLSLTWSADAPLSRGTLSLRGEGQVIGASEGDGSLPFELELCFEAAGPAHGMGARSVKGKDGQTYAAGRYEQPCDVHGVIALGAERTSFVGRGERDHSWGPRHWAMQWFFLVLEGARLRAQCTEVVIGGAMRICVGYVQEEEMLPVKDVRFALNFRDESDHAVAFEGSVEVDVEGGTLKGELVCLSGVALDDSHALPAGVPLYLQAKPCALYA